MCLSLSPYTAVTCIQLQTAVLSWYPYTAAVCIYLYVQLLPVFIFIYSCYLYLSSHRTVIFISIYNCCLPVLLHTDAVYHYPHGQLSSVFSSIYNCFIVFISRHSCFLYLSPWTVVICIYLQMKVLSVLISIYSCCLYLALDALVVSHHPHIQLLSLYISITADVCLHLTTSRNLFLCSLIPVLSILFFMCFCVGIICTLCPSVFQSPSPTSLPLVIWHLGLFLATVSRQIPHHRISKNIFSVSRRGVDKRLQTI